MKIILFICTIFFVASLASPLTALSQESSDTMSTEIFALKTQNAADMVQSLQPVLPAGSVVTSNGNNLIIKTTPQGFVEAKSLLATLDKVPQMLLISVRRVHNAEFDSQQSSQGNTISIGTRPASTNDQEQQVSVQEGRRAFVKTGEQIPVENSQISVFGASSNVTYQPVISGFYVVPKLIGNTASLNIVWKNSSVNVDEGTINNQPNPAVNSSFASTQPSINEEQTGTTLTVPLGQWSPLSKSSTQSLNNDSQTSYSTNDLQQPDTAVYIKVDIVSNPAQTRASYPQGDFANNNEPLVAN